MNKKIFFILFFIFLNFVFINNDAKSEPLYSTEKCKINHVYSTNIKFPKVFVVPIAFSDSSPSTGFQKENWEGDLLLQLDLVKNFYKQDSYGKTDFQFSYFPGQTNIKNDLSKVSILPFAYKNSPFDFDTDCRDCQIHKFFSDWLANSPKEWNLAQYDDLHFVALDSRVNWGGHLGNGFSSPSGGNLSVSVSNKNWHMSAHEFGHSIFRWIDNYDYRKTTAFGNGFDLMSVDGIFPIRDRRLFAWHRWLAGWLDDEEIRCVSPKIQSTHVLRNLFTQGKSPAAVILPLSGTKAVIVESRDGKSLIYVVDTEQPNGGGAVKVHYTKQFQLEEPNTSLSVEGVLIETKNCNKTFCRIKIAPNI